MTDVNIDIAHRAESMVGKSEKNGGIAISPGNYQWFFWVACDLFLLSGGSAMVAYYKGLSEISNIKTLKKRNV